MGDNGPGRESKWEDIVDKFPLIEGWCRDGLIDKQIAANLGIGLSTFYKYKSSKVEFSNLLKKNREVIDYEVENALLKRALGYETVEEHDSDKDGRKTITKFISGDVTAQIFWLKNRKPGVWRDKQEVQVDAHNVNENITALGDLLNKPVPDRQITDIEDE